MQITSNEANKLLKNLRSEISSLLSIESQSQSFVAATTENIEDARPEYNFAETQAKISELQAKTRLIKHTINVFNTTTTLPGLDYTIDEALVALPQLTSTVHKLSRMMQELPKSRTGGSVAGLIQYKYINYSLDEAKNEYNKLNDLVSKIQTSLDTVNNTIKFELPID